MATKNKCINCVFHIIKNDKDPDDWFNDDDEVIMCKKTSNESGDTYARGCLLPFKMIAGSLRPYETKDVNQPDWCPILKEQK